MRRVVITGIGAVTPLANNFNDSWKLIKSGFNGINFITKFDASNLKWKVAGELKGFEPEKFLSKKEVIKLDPFVQYALASSIMAAEDAGLFKLRSEILSSAGIIIGSSRGGITTIEKEIHKLCFQQSPSQALRISSYLMPSTTISMAASYSAQRLRIKGHCLGISNACASGTNAIGEAYRLIKSGLTDIVFAGGTEAPICRISVEGYGVSGALSKREDPSASRPFDISRDGFVIAEGSCMLVLEEIKSAIRRKTNIYAEIVGYSNTTDSYHMTRPNPESEAMAIMSALKDANLRADEIDYINAHATATIIGDKAEVKAIKMVFKDKSEIPVSAIKSMTGHMLAASGAFETACTALSIKEGIIPPTININEIDSDCDINIVKERKNYTIGNAITNSFGFGGVNAVLVLRNIED